jgi:hypothetical protein
MALRESVTVMTIKEFVTDANKLRLANKHKWVWWYGMVEGKEVRTKQFNTWVQIIEVDGRRDSGGMDIKVGAFKQFLTDAVS